MSKELQEILPEKIFEHYQKYSKGEGGRLLKALMTLLFERDCLLMNVPVDVLHMVFEYCMTEGFMLQVFFEEFAMVNKPVFNRLLSQETSINPGAIGAHLVFWAKERKEADILFFLKARGYSIDSPNPGGDTLLMMAIWQCDLPRIKALLRAGADPRCVTRNGENCLHIAASTGVVEVLKIILSFFRRVNCKDKFGATPLHHAARCAVVPLIELLVEAPFFADKTMRDRKQDTPLNCMIAENGLPLGLLTYPKWKKEYIPFPRGPRQLYRSAYVRKEIKLTADEKRLPEKHDDENSDASSQELKRCMSSPGRMSIFSEGGSKQCALKRPAPLTLFFIPEDGPKTAGEPPAFASKTRCLRRSTSAPVKTR